MTLPNSTPIFPGQVILTTARLGTANTNRDGTGTLVDVLTGEPNGTRVDRIVVQALVTTTAGMVRLFIDDGTTTRAFREIPVTAVTVGAGAIAFTAEVVRTDGLPVVNLPDGFRLRASTHQAEAFDLVCHGGSF